jgi:hypothetical protein
MNKCVPWGMVVFFKEYGHVLEGNVFFLRTNVLNYPSRVCSLAKKERLAMSMANSLLAQVLSTFHLLWFEKKIYI